MSGSAGALSGIGSTVGTIATSVAPYAGDIISTVGAFKSANSQTDQGYQVRALSELNVTNIRREAGLVREQSALDSSRLRKRNVSFSASQLALFAKSGVNALSGSALEVMSDDASVLELELLVNKFNLENKAAALEADASVENLRGDIAVRNAKATSRGTLLTQLPEYLPGVFSAVGDAYKATKGKSNSDAPTISEVRYS